MPFDISTLTTFNGTRGFILDGATNYSATGYSVGSGDLNGDGIAELIVGSPAERHFNFGSNGPGVEYILYGSTQPFPPRIQYNVTAVVQATAVEQFF